MEQGTFDLAAEPVPATVKLCECGCGQPAPIAKWTSKRNGHVKGQPQRFIRGHSAKVSPPPRKKRRLFVEIGQRIGRGVVIETGVPFVQPSGRVLRGARLLCDCGNEYTARLDALMGKTASTPQGVKSCGCLMRERRTSTMARAAAARRGRRSAQFVDRTGHRYGRLLVIKFAGTDRSSGNGALRANWLCQCDCGNKVIILATSLANGATRSCGCALRKLRLPPGVSARNQVLGGYQKGARKRGLSWELTEADFIRLTSQPCHYCGSSPSTAIIKANGRSVFVYNGLDRADNDLGYTLENVYPCCAVCNRAKKNMPLDEFMAWIERLAEYRGSRPPLRLLRGGA